MALWFQDPERIERQFTAARAARGRRRARAARAIERWMTGLRPYPTLALFLVPALFAEPAKLGALVLIGDGQILVGSALLISAFALGFLVAEGIYRANRAKLLGIPWFGRCHAIIAGLTGTILRRPRHPAL
jgi:hypothetical protein